jgi:hypothetical protein
MSYEPPTPPANLPTEIVNTLNESDPEQLRYVAMSWYDDNGRARTVTGVQPGFYEFVYRVRPVGSLCCRGHTSPNSGAVIAIWST